ncbi:MAG TPA: HD domain-containing protein [Victivallales bacterium]|nr:HD domain-containing protein [Victivallales bacterium]HPO90942.1 HD domain-containing protein [Victivallales bacterium]HRR06256.1 HD domain-containing protein [Victivallales bacterium]HRR28199.1 HD domain-containing protein [Victivallales bacterium]
MIDFNFISTLREESKIMLNYLTQKDPEITAHCIRVAKLSVKIAEKMNIKDDIFLSALANATAIHDIGKIQIKDEILKKKQLSPDEYEIIKTHTLFNIKDFFNFDVNETTQKVILQHHERENASGYPNALKKNQISLEAKICAVADSFDAMTSHRYYNIPKTTSEAIEELKNMSGEFYDEKVINAFLLCKT